MINIDAGVQINQQVLNSFFSCVAIRDAYWL